MKKRLILQISFGDDRGLVDVPENPNPYTVDFVWGCLRYFRTGEMPRSKTDVALFAEAERAYAKERYR